MAMLLAIAAPAPGPLHASSSIPDLAFAWSHRRPAAPLLLILPRPARSNKKTPTDLTPGRREDEGGGRDRWTGSGSLGYFAVPRARAFSVGRGEGHALPRSPAHPGRPGGLLPDGRRAASRPGHPSAQALLPQASGEDHL